MAALLKNQILKHLSKFTKNLSADKLNLSAIRGSCDVHNIELDEQVLMDLLELPVWMSLTKAFCNHVSLKVQWMKLKTVPIYIALDEVVVDIETCEDYRRDQTNNKAKGSPTHNDSGKYGFADRVVDGMTLTINSVIITFRSKVFNASLQLSRLMVESRTPGWKRCADLRMTRIKDTNRGQLLIFKHLEWQTLRFEAKAESNIMQTPLRLIANQASCRITIKKRLSDCAALGARIMFIFDDLLWVLTDAQLLSALHFADYLTQLIKGAPRTKHFSDNLSNPLSPTYPTLKNLSASSAQTAESNMSRLFSQFDIIETSHHIFVSRIEVHLCDDLDPNNGRSLHSSLKDGGALQVTVAKLLIDMYPYQKVISNRNHWLRYSDPSSSRSHWINEHLQSFADKRCKAMSAQSSGQTVRSTRNALSQLMSRVILIRLGDYSVNCVTTNTTTKLKLNDKLIATDKSAPLPDDMMALYMEINNYYYVDSNDAVPESAAFVHLAPLKVNFDALTLLWLNAFQANLHNAMVKLQEMLPKAETQRLNTRIECLMPMLSIKCPDDSDYTSFEIKSARIVAMNCETESVSFDGLNELMEGIGNTGFMYDRQSFPWLESDPKPVSDHFLTNLAKLKTKENSADIWTVRMEPLWAEFRSKKTNKFQPLLEPLPITLWAFESPIDPITKLSDKSEPDLSLLLCISSLVRVQLNHKQYLFLMRFLEQLSEFGVQLNSDTITIQSKDNASDENLFKSISLITNIPDIELTLKLEEDFQTSRSIGLSPQQSFLDLRSPSVNDKLSVDFEIQRTADNSMDKLVESSGVPKSHSDSLLSATSFDPNNQFAHKTEINDKPHKDLTDSSQIATSLTGIPGHLKLQNASLVTFKKTSSANSNSTLNDSDYNDFSVIDDDNRSIRSDLSAESDQFIVVGFETMAQEEEDIFGAQRIETADEVREDSTVESPSDDSDEANGGACHPPLDIPLSVTLIQIKISNLNLVQQSKGFHSKILMRASDVLLHEFTKMPYNDYQTLINQRVVNKTNNSFNNNNKSSELRLRLESFAKPDAKDELISVLVNDLELTLNMDTVMLLNDFITDPDSGYVPPTHILLNAIGVTLMDPKVSAPPLALRVPHLLIQRDLSNQMTVCPLNINDMSATKHLTVPHMKLRQRNGLTIDTMTGLVTKAHNGEDNADGVLDQVLKKNEWLMRQMDTISKENEELKRRLNQ